MVFCLAVFITRVVPSCRQMTEKLNKIEQTPENTAVSRV